MHQKEKPIVCIILFRYLYMLVLSHYQEDLRLKKFIESIVIIVLILTFVSCVRSPEQEPDNTSEVVITPVATATGAQSNVVNITPGQPDLNKLSLTEILLDNRTISLEKRLSYDDIKELDGEKLSILRCSILARHGYIFKTERYKSIFSNLAGYVPIRDNVEEYLTETDKNNINLIDINKRHWLKVDKIGAQRGEIYKEPCPIDFNNLNNAASEKIKEGKTKSETSDFLAQNSSIYMKANTLCGIVSADIDNDRHNEILITYTHKYSEDEKVVLTILGWKDNRLVELAYTDKLFDAYTFIDIEDYIKGGSCEIFLMEDESGWEYPEYQLFTYENGVINSVDMESLGLPAAGQFVELKEGTIAIGYRVTEGLFRFNDYEWDVSGFVVESSNTRDNRKLYKLDSKPLTEYEKTLPQLINNEVTVSNVYEFVESIGPNRKILLKPGVYDLNYLTHRIQNDYVRWFCEYDENTFGELFIENVANLTIEGLGDREVEIVTRRTDERVLSFFDSENIVLKNIIAGHGLNDYGSINSDGCTAAVLYFAGSNNIKIESCDLYGCGSYAISVRSVKGINVLDSILEECTSGAVNASNLQNAVFDNCVFSNNNGNELFLIDSSEGIMVKNSRITDNNSIKLKSDNAVQLEITNTQLSGNAFGNDTE